MDKDNRGSTGGYCLFEYLPGVNDAGIQAADRNLGTFIS